MHVMAAILRAADGRVLLAQRPPGKHLAGLWEFAGGKLEPGETRMQGLVREIREELDVTIEAARPWMWLPWSYGERRLQLDVWMVSAWRGQPRGREGQAIAWRDPGTVDLASMAGADRMVLRALQLPAHYRITPADIPPSEADSLRQQLQAWLEAGGRLLRLRLPQWSCAQVRALAADLQRTAVETQAALLLSGDVEGARQLGAGVGVHLRASDLAERRERPLPLWQRVGASCHDAGELARAKALDVDFATLSPVRATASHPGAAGMGWSRFAELAAASSVPVYALGGMQAEDLDRAREAGAQGLAGIRGFLA